MNRICILLCIIIMPSFVSYVNADNVVQPEHTSSLHPWIGELYAYVAGSTFTHSNFWSGCHTTYSKLNYDLEDKYVNVGLACMFFRHSYLRFGGEVGYQYEYYTYADAIKGTGFDTHWLTLNLNLSSQYFCCLGVKSDILLGTKSNNQGNANVEGITSQCFNPVALAAYAGPHCVFGPMKVECRLGYWFFPHINAANVAMTNMYSTYMGSFYWEINLAYKLFSNGHRGISNTTILN